MNSIPASGVGPRLSLLRHLALVSFLWNALILSPCSAAGQKLSFHFDGGNNLTFDTGVVKGAIVKDGTGEALRPISFVDPDVPIDDNHGLLMPYRFLTPQRRYGFGAWEWERTGKILESGAAEFRWLGTSDRPFNLSAIYDWKTDDTLDFVIQYTPLVDMDKFELFVGSYFQKFTDVKVYARDGGGRRAGFIPVDPQTPGNQFFPRGDDVLSMINDGRWTFPPYPQPVVIRPTYAAPIGIKREPKSGATVLMMAPPDDCFAITAMGSWAMYLNFFGKDVKKGQTLVGHARLVFGMGITDAQAVSRYNEYLSDLKAQIEESFISHAEADSLREFAASPVRAAPPAGDKQLDLSVKRVDGSDQVAEYTLRGVVPSDAKQAVFGFRVNSNENQSKGPCEFTLYQVSYKEGKEQPIYNSEFSPGLLRDGFWSPYSRFQHSDISTGQMVKVTTTATQMAGLNSQNFPVTGGAAYTLRLRASVALASKGSGYFALIFLGTSNENAGPRQMIPLDAEVPINNSKAETH